MNEYFNCPNCSGPIEIHELECDYCGSILNDNEAVTDLKDFIKRIDQMFDDASMEDIISKCENSKYKNHPIVSFRKLKANLIHLMTDDGIFDFDDFQKIYRTIRKLGSISTDYLDNFILYIEILFPTIHTEIPSKEFKKIKDSLSIEEEFDANLLDKLKCQMAHQAMGPSQFREYSYYTEPKNFIDDSYFRKKKLALEEKYELILKQF